MEKQSLRKTLTPLLFGLMFGLPGTLLPLTVYAAKANRPVPKNSSQACPTTRACGAEETRQSIRETKLRPEYQKSENYYLHGEHGLSR